MTGKPYVHSYSDAQLVLLNSETDENDLYLIGHQPGKLLKLESRIMLDAAAVVVGAEAVKNADDAADSQASETQEASGANEIKVTPAGIAKESKQAPEPEKETLVADESNIEAKQITAKGDQNEKVEVKIIENDYSVENDNSVLNDEASEILKYVSAKYDIKIENLQNQYKSFYSEFETKSNYDPQAKESYQASSFASQASAARSFSEQSENNIGEESDNADDITKGESTVDSAEDATPDSENAVTENSENDNVPIDESGAEDVADNLDDTVEDATDAGSGDGTDADEASDELDDAIEDEADDQTDDEADEISDEASDPEDAFLVTTLLDIVNPNDGETSLREALNAASTADEPVVIEFDETAFFDSFEGGGDQSIIFLDFEFGELSISEASNSITIDASNFSEQIIIDAQMETRHFFILDSTVTFNNIEFRNGFSEAEAGSIFASNESFITFTDSVFTENQSLEFGGAVYISAGTNLLIENSILRGNQAGEGGAIYAANATLSARNTQFINNEATLGGAILGFWGANIQIEQSDFQNNTATQDGGAIFITGQFENPSYLDVQSTNFSSNLADFGGAIFLEEFVNTTLSSASFIDNTAFEGGGIFVLFDNELQIIQSTFSGNSAEDGFGDALLIATNNQIEFILSSFGDNQTIDAINFGESEVALIEMNLVGNLFGGDFTLDDFTSSPISGDYNIFMTGIQTPEFSDSEGENNTFADELFSSELQDNGGSTLTFLPSENALNFVPENYLNDQDIFIELDQRGLFRNAENGFDAGSVDINMIDDGEPVEPVDPVTPVDPIVPAQPSPTIPITNAEADVAVEAALAASTIDSITLTSDAIIVSNFADDTFGLEGHVLLDTNDEEDLYRYSDYQIVSLDVFSDTDFERVDISPWDNAGRALIVDNYENYQAIVATEASIEANANRFDDSIPAYFTLYRDLSAQYKTEAFELSEKYTSDDTILVDKAIAKPAISAGEYSLEKAYQIDGIESDYLNAYQALEQTLKNPENNYKHDFSEQLKSQLRY